MTTASSRSMEMIDRLGEAARAIAIGGGGIAFITLTEMKDSVTILVGLVTASCLLYTTFCKRSRRKRKPKVEDEALSADKA